MFNLNLDSIYKDTTLDQYGYTNEPRNRIKAIRFKVFTRKQIIILLYWRKKIQSNGDLKLQLLEKETLLLNRIKRSVFTV